MNISFGFNKWLKWAGIFLLFVGFVSMSATKEKGKKAETTTRNGIHRFKKHNALCAYRSV